MSMSLRAELGYEFKPANPLQRVVQAFASTRAGGWLFSKLLRHLDNLVGRLSRGRTSAPAVLAALPVLDLTTTGRKSGARRTTHLISVPVGDTLALLGTNFGQGSTPAWVLNLEAEPRASVTYRGRAVDVVARPASQSEYDEVMASSSNIYGGYAKYQQRITGRTVRIFVLEHAGS